MSFKFNPLTGQLDMYGSPGGGSGTPGGLDQSFQFNDGGVFNGSSVLYLDAGQVRVDNGLRVGSGGVTMINGDAVSWDFGGGQIIVLDAGNTSAAHTLYLPDADGTLAIERPIYGQQNYEKTDTYVYVGYEEPDGAWYIYRRTLVDNVQEYASDVSDYATNWADRAILTYA